MRCIWATMIGWFGEKHTFFWSLIGVTAVMPFGLVPPHVVPLLSPRQSTPSAAWPSRVRTSGRYTSSRSESGLNSMSVKRAANSSLVRSVNGPTPSV